VEGLGGAPDGGAEDIVSPSCKALWIKVHCIRWLSWLPRGSDVYSW